MKPSIHRISSRWSTVAVALGVGSILAVPPIAHADWISEVSTSNPLHWFRFDEAPGATVAVDYGSGSTSGDYLGGVTLGDPGLVGSAAMFDGTGHVLVGGADLSTDWTVEAIFYANTDTGGASMGLLGADFTAATRIGIKAEQWNETGQLGYTSFGVADVTLGGAGAATPASYAHVAFVGQGSGVELFVDGVSVATDALSVPLSRHVLGAAAVRDTGEIIDGLTGGIDELVIYDRALAPAEIAAHFGAIPEPTTAAFALAAAGFFVLVRPRRRRP